MGMVAPKLIWSWQTFKQPSNFSGNKAFSSSFEGQANMFKLYTQITHVCDEMCALLNAAVY